MKRARNYLLVAAIVLAIVGAAAVLFGLMGKGGSRNESLIFAGAVALLVSPFLPVRALRSARAAEKSHMRTKKANRSSSVQPFDPSKIWSRKWVRVTWYLVIMVTSGFALLALILQKTDSVAYFAVFLTIELGLIPFMRENRPKT